MRHACCKGTFDEETFTEEAAFGDAATSLVGDTAFVDTCTSEAKDSPAS